MPDKRFRDLLIPAGATGRPCSARRGSAVATILLIENRFLERRPLARILRSKGHIVIEASDAARAFAMLDEPGQARPDMILAEILMPMTNGVAFVQQLRARPSGAALPVVFRAAAYHEREALAAARAAGASGVLVGAISTRAVLDAIDAALRDATPAPGPASDAAATALAARDRLAATLQIGQAMLAETDGRAMLEQLCAGARDLTFAEYAIAGIFDADGASVSEAIACGLEDAERVGASSVEHAVLRTVVGGRRAVRVRNPAGRPEALGLPTDHAPVVSLLSVPIATPERVYGWLSLRNKLGADAFSEADEQAAAAVAAHAALAYEHAQSIASLRGRVAHAEQELRCATARAERARDDERARISRSLHDQLGQALIGLKMDVHWLRTQLAPEPGDGAFAIAGRLESMLRQLDDTLQAVRELSSELRSIVLDELGLLAAIEMEAKAFERRSGIRCRVDARIDRLDLDGRQSAGIFRIVQEALTNVLLHASASRATIAVRRTPRGVSLAVADNGRGIQQVDLTSGDSLGLLGMHERATLVGARLQVDRRKPSGTIVRVTVPDARPRARP
jgi:signal transduction histidine kinase